MDAVLDTGAVQTEFEAIGSGSGRNTLLVSDRDIDVNPSVF